MKLSAFIVFATLLISCSQNPKASFLKSNPDFQTTFENRLAAIYGEYKLSGDFIIGIVNQNGLVYSYALNKDILEEKPSSLNDDSPIYLASHTKSFTGTLLKILEEDGKVDLDKTIHDYLPELEFDGSIDTGSITVRQLLNHTHGINSTQFIWKTAFLGYEGGNEELIDALNSNFRYDPSHQFRYSNNGPVLAGMIVEKVTGNSWKAEMKKRIFLPLDMTNTGSNVSDFNIKTIRPAIQMTKDHEVFQSGFYKKDITMHAAGGTISTVTDLAKWLQFNINRETSIIKNKRSFDELHGPTTKQDRTYFTYKRHGYSLGWDIANYQTDTLLTRFGSYAGITFHLSFLPAKKVGIIAFSSEGRASQLPHLAANYAYNLIARNPNSDKIFDDEKAEFTAAYDRANNRPLPSKEMKVVKSDENDKLVGNYKNDMGWPDIVIKKGNSNYEFNWGVLSGPIYKIPDPNRPYLSSLGALMRTFNVQEKNGVVDSLFTGSLKYNKIN